MRDQARYERQTRLAGVGPEGQARLGASTALLVGCGALGTVAAELLARAGVGHLVIVDRDVVELSNLHRQTLFEEDDARRGLPKAEAAARRLGRINSGVRVTALPRDLAPRNAERVTLAAGRPDVLLDGTDTFATRLLLNDLAVKHGLPLVYAGVVGTRGTAGLFLPGAGPCLRCLLATPPPPGAAPTCESAGVLGAASALVAAQQAAWALKVLVGAATPEDCRLVELDPWEGAWRSLVLGHRPGPPGPERDCPCCAQRRFDYLDAGETESTALCGADSVQVWPPSAGALDLPALASHLGRSAAVTASAFAVRAVLREERADFPSPREGPGAGASTAGPEDPPSVPLELTVFADGRALVRGTRDPARARSIYARYLGG